MMRTFLVLALCACPAPAGLEPPPGDSAAFAPTADTAERLRRLTPAPPRVSRGPSATGHEDAGDSCWTRVPCRSIGIPKYIGIPNPSRTDNPCRKCYADFCSPLDPDVYYSYFVDTVTGDVYQAQYPYTFQVIRSTCR